MDRVCSSSESPARSLTDLLKGILHQIKFLSPKPHIFLGCGIACFGKRAKKPPKLEDFVSKFVPRGFEARRGTGY